MTAAARSLPPDLVAPRYGDASLADVMPSLLAALGVAGEPDVLGLDPAVGACLLVIDGLGWDQLRVNPDDAPFLTGLITELHSRPLTAGFPTTTTTSLASLGTGLPAGQHGITGYQMWIPGSRQTLNGLQWDLSTGPSPYEWQPMPTALERAETANLPVAMLAPVEFAESGLTRAALRGGRFVGLSAGEAYGAVVGGLVRDQQRGLVCVYYGGLDRAGHTVGVLDQRWRDELGVVDRLARELEEALPSGTMFAVTADHGMVDIDPAQLVEVSDHPTLRIGVHVLAGEGRCRYVHAVSGAERDVLAIWSDELDDAGFAVLPKDAVIDLGLLGPTVTSAAAERVGDVVVLARGNGAVFDRRVDARRIRQLAGQHGSLTAAEAYVPLLVHQVA